MEQDAKPDDASRHSPVEDRPKAAGKQLRRAAPEPAPEKARTGPIEVPVRVDFAGGWLDCPQFARADGFIVNCAVTPMVRLDHWVYERNSGIGGSAAYSALMGVNAVEAELQRGVGWQDPAVIAETGLCSWVSGHRPVLDMKTSGEFLRGHMALHWTGKPHNTPSLAGLTRDWDLIAEASRLARYGVRAGTLALIAGAVRMSYSIQLQEGMDPLSQHGEIAKKYCGSGFGGYALYLFTFPTERDTFVSWGCGRIAIEPYVRIAIKPYVRQPGS